MAHEIRTPMNGFLGMMQLLERTPLSGKQTELLRFATTSFHNLMAVLNGILDYTKIEEGMVTMTRVPFNLRRVVKEVVLLFAPSALEKQLAMHPFIDPGLPDRWMGDPFRLRQVMSNLVGNAVKYTQTGAIHLTVEKSPDEEHVCNADKNGSHCLLFTVRDTGIGIDARHLDKLFTRFSQVDASLTRNYSGTGLGLAICKGLVENMGGRIWVESEPGVGSTFRFTCVLQVPDGDKQEASRNDAP